jgi:DNA transformation protein and related proteins
MASDQATVDFIIEQASRGNDVRARKMFGEYGVYCDDVFVGIVAGDQLYLKVTESGENLLPDVEHASPYDGAQPHIVVGEEVIEDADRLSEVMRATASALPPPKPKRTRTS